MRAFVLAALALGSLSLPAAALPSGLGGSPASMVQQHAAAMDEDYTFVRTPADVQELERGGALVPVTGNAHYALSKVSFASARPEVLSFIERFSAGYHEATGRKLVVTSLTRPTALQPRNAHKLSVHPAGMAVDLRVPADATDRAWLERELLALERRGLIDVTRERSPAHYHIAVFGAPYRAYSAKLEAAEAQAREAGRRAAVQRALAYVLPAGDDGREGPPAGLLIAGMSLLACIPVTRRVRAARSCAVGQNSSL